ASERVWARALDELPRCVDLARRDRERGRQGEHPVAGPEEEPPTARRLAHPDPEVDVGRVPLEGGRVADELDPDQETLATHVADHGQPPLELPQPCPGLLATRPRV